MVHGSLRAPVEEYLLGPESAEATLRRLKSRFCLVGHSHIPFICLETGGAPLFQRFTEGQPFPLGQERLIINPGCVGQPRDRDPRPSYAIYDSKAENHRAASGELQHTDDATEDAGCQAAGLSDRAPGTWSVAVEHAGRLITRFSRDVRCLIDFQIRSRISW